MSQRFVLVPSEMHNNMLSRFENAQNEIKKPKLEENYLDPMHDASKKMQKILENNTLDDTTRNALFNNELKRYLRVKKEAEDRPVKVQITNLLKDFMGNHENDNNNNSNNIITDTTSSTQRLEANSNVSLENEETPAKMDSPNVPFNTQKQSHEFPTNMDISRSKRSALRIDKENFIEEKAEELAQLLWLNKTTFGIDRNGKILDSNGRAIKDSDYKMAAKRLLNGQNTFSPPGMRHLRPRVLQSPAAKRIIDSTSEQIGSGFFGNEEVTYLPKFNNNNVEKSNLIPLFEPKLWDKPPGIPDSDDEHDIFGKVTEQDYESYNEEYSDVNEEDNNHNIDTIFNVINWKKIEIS